MKRKTPIPMIKSVMTPFPYAVELDRPVSDAKALMAVHDIRHLPVTEQGKLVGVITERDIRRALDPVFGLPPLCRAEAGARRQNSAIGDCEQGETQCCVRGLPMS